MFTFSSDYEGGGSWKDPRSQLRAAQPSFSVLCFQIFFLPNSLPHLFPRGFNAYNQIRSEFSVIFFLSQFGNFPTREMIRDFLLTFFEFEVHFKPARREPSLEAESPYRVSITHGRPRPRPQPPRPGASCERGGLYWIDPLTVDILLAVAILWTNQMSS